jgi:clan AA aspartic protease (TIGR02281 family)
MWATFLSGFLLLFFCLPTHDPFATEFFRWFDEKGTIHFADNPRSVPERYRNQSPKHEVTRSREAILHALVPTDETSNTQKFIVALTREDGRLLVNGTINHGSVRFIVDTGSSMTIIPATIASRLGVNSKRDPLIGIRAVGGSVEGRLTEIDSLRVGNAEVKNFDIIVVEDSLGGVGLLGADFLSRFQVDINYSREQMMLHLGEGSYDGYPAVWWQEKFRLYGRLKQTYEQRIKQNEDHLRSLGINPAQRNWANAYSGKVNFLQPVADEIKEHEHYLRVVEKKVADLQIRASRAELPRYLRE